MNKLLRRKLGTKGFTLIELIVVIAILAILAVIAIPRLMGFTERARTSAEEANARTLYNAITIAFADDVTPTLGTKKSLEEISGLNKYLDEWPDDEKDLPFQAVVSGDDTNGWTVGVFDSDGNHLAGAATPTPTTP